MSISTRCRAVSTPTCDSRRASLGLDNRWPEICAAYAEANQLFGDIVKVTPSSKVVGDLALFMVTNNLTADDIMNAAGPLSFPRSVVEMMQGLLGEPEGGWPKRVSGRSCCSRRRPSRSTAGPARRCRRPTSPRPPKRFASRPSASLARRTCCRTCSIRRSSSTSWRIASATATRRTFPPRISSTACSPATRLPSRSSAARR